MAWQWPIALLCVSFIGIATFSFKASAKADVVAAAFPPWWSKRDAFLAIAAADAAVVRETAIPTAIVVRVAAPNGLAKLTAAGAWFLIDPQAVAACLSSRPI